MESKPITAEAFFNTHWNLGKPINEIMVLFAKHHREKAIEAVKDLDVIQDLYGEIGNSKIREIEEGIENAYKESEIK